LTFGSACLLFASGLEGAASLTEAILGAAFGFDVDSEWSFRFLPGGAGPLEADVDDSLLAAEAAAVAELLRDDRCGGARISPHATYHSTQLVINAYKDTH
jgi:hypothetical protein